VKYQWECKFCLQRSGNFKSYRTMRKSKMHHAKYYCNLIKMYYGDMKQYVRRLND